MTGKKIISKRTYLGIEFMLLFFGVPVYLFFDEKLIHPSAILIPVLIFILLILRFRTSFKFRELIAFRISRKRLIINGLRILLIGIALLSGVWLFDRENLFNLPRGNPLIWGMLCVFYPIFSAYAQEIIYRTFVFRRYHELFHDKLLFILASGMSFSFIHIVYYSPLSIILTLLMGFYLAYEYIKTGSVLFTAILHGLLGNIVFTVGLGQYFWLDMYRWI